jgi:cytosine/adenosine deaminase-related metal-dependent hydrolase
VRENASLLLAHGASSPVRSLAMALQAIFARRVFTPYEEIADAVILTDGEKIAAVGRPDEVSVPPSARRHDKRDFSVVPGFIDVHIHGASGYDVMDSSPEALVAITTNVAGRGTTSVVATTLGVEFILRNGSQRRRFRSSGVCWPRQRAQPASSH